MIQTVALDHIDPGANDRKTFDAVKLAELAASLNEIGMITPPVVRPLGQRFQPFAYAEIIEIRDVCLAEMTDADALADGYADADADALRAAVVEMLARPSDQASLDVGLANVEKLRLLRWRLRPDVLEASGKPTH